MRTLIDNLVVRVIQRHIVDVINARPFRKDAHILDLLVGSHRYSSAARARKRTARRIDRDDGPQQDSMTVTSTKTVRAEATQRPAAESDDEPTKQESAPSGKAAGVNIDENTADTDDHGHRSHALSRRGHPPRTAANAATRAAICGAGRATIWPARRHPALPRLAGQPPRAPAQS